MLFNLQQLKEKYNLNIRGVIHIGAHFGEENHIYDQLSIENRIFFEPLVSNYQKLIEKVGDKFIAVNKALGDENKQIEMFVESANQGQSSSILEPDLHLKQYPHIKFEKKEIVEMVRLDDFLSDINKYNFINIDVQGYELEVFKGSSKSLKNIDYILSEINRGEVYKNCAKIEQLVEFLNPYGFELVEQTWDGITWGDGFFVKK